MVNVHIHQFAPGGAVVDATAMEQFQKQWGAYQKLVDSDVLSHRAAGETLHRVLAGIDRPFTFLDIACGDASLTKRALAGTRVSHYHGIDLSEPAIELAGKMLDGAPYEVDLDHQDFVTALEERPEPADVVWCGLSIHHLVTADKLKLMKAIRGATGNVFVLNEPSRRDGEDREAWLRRFLGCPGTDVDDAHPRGAPADRQSYHHQRPAGDRFGLDGSRPAGRLLEGDAALRRPDRRAQDLPLRRVRRDHSRRQTAGSRSRNPPQSCTFLCYPGESRGPSRASQPAAFIRHVSDGFRHSPE